MVKDRKCMVVLITGDIAVRVWFHSRDRGSSHGELAETCDSTTATDHKRERERERERAYILTLFFVVSFGREKSGMGLACSHLDRPTNPCGLPFPTIIMSMLITTVT